ncbi:MAG: hypothetical protein ACKOW6_01835 [Fluviibacter sp.]
MLDDIKKTLWAAADKLRANMDAAELAKRFADPKDEYFLDGADALGEAWSEALG